MTTDPAAGGDLGMHLGRASPKAARRRGLLNVAPSTRRTIIREFA